MSDAAGLPLPPSDAHTCLGFAAGCRLHPTRAILLIPEGSLELLGPTRAVLELVDGRRSVDAIVRALLDQFEAPDPVALRKDVTELLRRLVERGVLREVACG